MPLVAGKMYRPTDVIADTANNSVFVVEQFNHRISKWTYSPPLYEFTLDGSWGSNNDGTSGEGAPIGDGGVTDNALYRPTGIAFNQINGFLYVTDTFHHRVRTLDASTGEFISSIGTGGSATDEFYRPAGIAINSALDSPVVIADEFNHRAVRYVVSGSDLITPTVLDDPSDSADLSFIRPHGVVFDASTSEFNVTDSIRGLISRYDSAGNFQNQYGTPGTTGTDVFYPGSGIGLLSGTNATIFADTRNNDLKTMENEVIVVTVGTTPGTGEGQLYYPESANAFLDTANYVLAANTRNNRVEAYSNVTTTLTFQSNFGSP